MDPDANLKEQLEISTWLLEHGGLAHPETGEPLSELPREYREKAERLAELVVALDEWLGEKKGFLPQTWGLR